MQLLISTHSSLVLWDGQARVIQEGRGVYYGITWDRSRLYVVSRAVAPGRVQVFDAELNLCDPLPLDVGEDAHQCLWWNGTLYVTDTARNRIVTWDGKRAGVIRWLPEPDGPRRDEHINSIWRDGPLFYVVEHRYQALPKHIRVFSWEFQQVGLFSLAGNCLADGPCGSGLHNVYVENGVLYTLGPYRVLRVDLASGELEAVALSGVIPQQHYLRGLARAGGYFFVGCSTAAPRDQREHDAGAVLVLDDDLVVVERISVEGLGQVLEVRAVEGDLAHNGVRCPVVGVGY